MQALNYTTKAIEALSRYPCPGAPGTLAGMRYIADKLRQAEVFVLANHGELIDRSRPRPEVPGLIYKPPFPVVALEYAAAQKQWGSTVFTEARSTRRIALAWEWADDLPPLLREWAPTMTKPGVCTASICYYDDEQMWMPIAAGMFTPFDTAYIEQKFSPFRDEMVKDRRQTSTAGRGKVPEAHFIALLPDTLDLMFKKLGENRAFDHLNADLMDESNAYLDLCVILSCKNVDAVHVPIDARLNRSRVKSGKLPFKDFHVLTISGDEHGNTGSSGGGQSPRPHLRRGHIRRIGPDRITWVNATMVRGRGEPISKVYAVRARSGGAGE
jgi:hypothetical protein